MKYTTPSDPYYFSPLAKSIMDRREYQKSCVVFPIWTVGFVGINGSRSLMYCKIAQLKQSIFNHTKYNREYKNVVPMKSYMMSN
jgi:hypothetical protein